MTNQLFIIGNGFDLHHGIASKFSDFAAYLEHVDPDTFSIAEEYVVPEKDLWSDLEARFAEIDVDQIEDHAGQFLVSYGAEEWSDAYHHDYEYEVEQICDAISKKMRNHFADWVRQIEIPPNTITPINSINPSAFFLTFNYTHTLQQLYNISANSILHIHGSASDLTTEIVLGHGWERQASDLRSSSTDEDTDVRAAGGSRLLDDLLASTFKPTSEILSRNKAFFECLRSVTEVFVFGHSLAQVDQPYFRAVLDHVQADASWTISFHCDEGDTRLAADRIGIPTSRLHLELLKNL